MYQQLIDGTWRDAVNGGSWDLVDPGKGEVVDRVPYGDADDARAAVDAAAEAGPAWAATQPHARADILRRAAGLLVERADDHARVTTEESGKPLSQARAEWLSAANYLTFAAEECTRIGGRIITSRVPGRRIDVIYRPVGVVGVISAWNFPVYNVNRAVSSALAAGCTVAARPSEYTPRSAMLYGAALQDAGAPAGTINVINGDPESMGQLLLDDARVRKIQFTGSARVGKLLMDGASRTVTRLSLELGGNAPVLVFPDADLAAVAASGVVAKTRNAGQVCIAPQRFLVHGSVADRFAELAGEAMAGQRVGHGFDEDTTVGPLINATQLERVQRIVTDSADAGAGVVVGGGPLDRSGYFYAPTVLSDVPLEAPAVTEEIFGPVLPIQRFDDVDEAVSWANRTEHGLTAFVWTSDLRTALTVSERLDFGMIGINDWYPVTPEAPFGGVKQSGFGRESGTEGIMEYLEPTTRYFGSLG